MEPAGRLQNPLLAGKHPSPPAPAPSRCYSQQHDDEDLERRDDGDSGISSLVVLTGGTGRGWGAQGLDALNDRSIYTPCVWVDECSVCACMCACVKTATQTDPPLPL